MFVGTGTPRKPEGRAVARRLREQGEPYHRIATALGISVSSAFNWTSDIELTPERHHHNLVGPRGPQNPEHIAARVRAWSKRARDKRSGYQEEGRRRAGPRDDHLHEAGCMLYWAEGAKDRNCLCFANSDLHMVKFFVCFLRDSIGVSDDDFAIRFNVYTNNGLSIRQIEDYWLKALKLPRTCLRGHTLNHNPTSSSGKKRGRLPYGVCQVRVLKSTQILQHIYGAIQEYAGFDEPRWLD
jgi:hypothetical protein